MGLPVESIEVGLREEGLGFGLPMCFIELGYTDEKMEVEDTLREVLGRIPKRGWVCIRGSHDPLVCGIGTLVRGLSQLQRYVEVETNGLLRDPSWTHTVDRWIVNYQGKPAFNYGALRATDTIRILLDSMEGANRVEEALGVCSKLNCVKYLRSPKGAQKGWIDLAVKFERVRVY